MYVHGKQEKITTPPPHKQDQITSLVLVILTSIGKELFSRFYFCYNDQFDSNYYYPCTTSFLLHIVDHMNTENTESADFCQRYLSNT